MLVTAGSMCMLVIRMYSADLGAKAWCLQQWAGLQVFTSACQSVPSTCFVIDIYIGEPESKEQSPKWEVEVSLFFSLLAAIAGLTAWVPASAQAMPYFWCVCCIAPVHFFTHSLLCVDQKASSTGNVSSAATVQLSCNVSAQLSAATWRLSCNLSTPLSGQLRLVSWAAPC